MMGASQVDRNRYTPGMRRSEFFVLPLAAGLIVAAAPAETITAYWRVRASCSSAD